MSYLKIVLKQEQYQVFRNIVDIIKTHQNKTNIVLKTKNGEEIMEISSINDCCTHFLHFSVRCSVFEKYSCQDSELYLGINFEDFLTRLKIFDQKCELNLLININKLDVLKLKNGLDPTESGILHLINVDSDDMSNYGKQLSKSGSMKIIISPRVFSDICSKCKNNKAETMRINYSVPDGKDKNKGKLKFISGNGVYCCKFDETSDSSKIKWKYNPESKNRKKSNNKDNQHREKNDSDSDINVCFELEPVVNIKKCTSQSKYVMINIGNGRPIHIAYHINIFDEKINLLLSPSVSNEKD